MAEEAVQGKQTDKEASRLPALIAAARQKSPDWWARALAALALFAGVGAWSQSLVLVPPMVSRNDLESVRVEIRTIQQKQQSILQDIESLRLSMAASPQPQSSTGKGVSEEQLQTAVESLRADIGKQQMAVGGKEVQTQIAQLKSDLAVANAAISAVHDQVKGMADTAKQAVLAEENTRAQMIAFLQLRNAAAAATPFTAELKALSDVAGGTPELAAALAKLDNAAHAGVATLPMLQARFNVMAGPAEQAMELAAAKHWWEKFLANIKDVFSIRKLDAQGNSDASRTLYEAAAALQRGNIQAAVTQVETLPQIAQKHLQEWLADAKARLELDAALGRIGAMLGQAVPHPSEKAVP